MKSLKMLAVAGALITSGAFISISAVAETYSTTVAVNNLARSLAWQEATTMQFPAIMYDGLTANGQTCYTYNSDAQYNTLCPGARDSVTDATYAITGVPNATVLFNLDNAPKTVEGIKFQPVSYTGGTITLDANGAGSHPIGGMLTLMDEQANVSDSITFTYDLEFTAQ